MNCTSYSLDGPTGISDTLRSVDCATGQATAFAFDHLFGSHGTLTAALTGLLTIYVALLAIGLLTGRSTLRLTLITPRALALGAALTFATSWVAYQQVVWNLAAGAPDQIAGLVTGSKGPAIAMFAHRLDAVFNAISGAASAAAPAQEGAKGVASVAPQDLLWGSALLLLLGTAGVLLVARIALAALLAVGPVFILLSIFDGTRGLFEGWLKAAVMLAVVPLLVVLVGGGALMLMDPMLGSLEAAGGAPSMRLAVGLVLGSCVYVALMLMSVKAASVLTGGWRLPRSPSERGGDAAGFAVTPALAPSIPASVPQSDQRIRQMVMAANGPSVSITSTPVHAGVPLASPAATSPSRSHGAERVRGMGARQSYKKEAAR